MAQPVIEKLQPSAGIEGGEVVITCKDLTFGAHDQFRVTFGGVASRPISASPTKIIVPVPSFSFLTGAVPVSIDANGHPSEGAQFTIGQKLAENLHPVANPAYDRDTGAIYTTLSGTRGQKIPVSVYKITSEGESEPFISDLVNPTSIAFSPEGEMFITSRYDGSVYRVTPFKDAEVFARNLGVATGITFDAEGKMFVGDRNGTVYIVNDIGEATTFATLEPSISAFHLGFGPDGYLYATGPAMSSFDSVMRIDREGEVTKFYTGLGRPQGFAFDKGGNMYVAASYHGHRGIVRITPDGTDAEVVVAGSSLVGLCFDDHGNMIIASGREIFRIPFDVEGYWPF